MHLLPALVDRVCRANVVAARVSWFCVYLVTHELRRNFCFSLLVRAYSLSLMFLSFDF